MSLAILNHAQWFHRDVDMGDQLLCVQDPPSSQGGWGMTRAQIFNSPGRLVSTITQEGMVHMPTGSQSDGDPGRWWIRMGEGDDGSAIPG